MNSTDFAFSSFENCIEPLDEEAFHYLEWLEEHALSALTEVWNGSNGV